MMENAARWEGESEPRGPEGPPKRCRKRWELETRKAGAREGLKSQPGCPGLRESQHGVLCGAVLRTPRFSPKLQPHPSVAGSQEGVMAKAAATGRNLSLVLFLILPLICLVSSHPTDTHSLSCKVIVRARPALRQPWYEVQCSLDGESFLQYDNHNKATPLGDLGKAVHDTQMWTDLIQRLEYLGQELRKILANTKQETADPSGHPTLQTIMNSKYKQEQIIDASWRFNISGKYFFILNTMNMSWTPFSLEARGIMNDEQFIKDLKVISTADSSYWLKELLKHQKEKPRPTSRAPDIIYLPPTIDVTPHPSTRQFPNNKESIIIAVVISIIIIIILIIIFIRMCVKRKCCPQGDSESGALDLTVKPLQREISSSP